MRYTNNAIQALYGDIQSFRAQVQYLSASKGSTSEYCFHKPCTFSGKPVHAFIDHLESYLEQFPEEKRRVIATIYLADNAYNWFDFMRTSEV